MFRTRAEHSSGALLVTFWHQCGMPADSGTPTEWLLQLSARIVNLHCECPVATAAERFTRRERHPGHLDELTSYSVNLRTIRAVAELEPIQVGKRVYCDTSFDADVVPLAKKISAAGGDHQFQR